MKKLALLSFILLAGLTACKKKTVKPKEDTSPNGLITRINWHSVHIHHDFYDQNDKRVYRTPDSIGVEYKFQNNQVQITNLDNSVKSGTYGINQSNTGAQLLNLTFNNHTETFNVDTLTESYFYYSQEKANSTYTLNGVQYPAAKEKTLVYLRCDCGQ